MVKNGRNNGGSGENEPMLDECARNGTEEGGEDDLCFVLWSITASLSKKPAVKVRITADSWLEPALPARG